LLELVVNLEGVGRVRARALFNAGYRTIEDLAKANLSELTRVHGIGERVASSILEQARQLVNEGKVVKFTEAAISGQGKSARGGLLDHIL